MSEVNLIKAAAAEILTDRTQRYRRNVIGLAVVITALTALPFVKFSKLRLLGLELDKSVDNPELLVIGALWLVMIYHALIYAWFTARDWRVWRSGVVRFSHDGSSSFRIGFPQIRNYFGYKPFGKAVERDCRNKQLSINDLEFERGEDAFAWIVKIKNPKPGDGTSHHLYSVGGGIWRIIRQKIQQFVMLEIGFPVALLLAGAVATWTWSL